MARKTKVRATGYEERLHGVNSYWHCGETRREDMKGREGSRLPPMCLSLTFGCAMLEAESSFASHQNSTPGQLCWQQTHEVRCIAFG